MRLKKVTLKNGNVIIDTGLPQRGLKPAALNMHTDMLNKLYDIASHDEKLADGTVSRLSRMLVNTIFDMARRDEALQAIAKCINEEVVDPGLNREERNRAEGDVWLDLGVREFIEALDAYMGVSHRLAIGTFGSAGGECLPEPKPELGPETCGDALEDEWRPPLNDD